MLTSPGSPPLLVDFLLCLSLLTLQVSFSLFERVTGDSTGDGLDFAFDSVDSAFGVALDLGCFDLGFALDASKKIMGNRERTDMEGRVGE